MIDLEDLTTNELIELYSGILKELKQRNVIRTRNIVGEIGEYLAINHYCNHSDLPNLQAAPIGTQNVDAISRNGERYSIKSTSGKVTGVFWGLNPPDSPEKDDRKFEYVIICLFDNTYCLNAIYELPWDKFLKHKKWHKRMNAWNLSITKALKKDCKIIYETNR
jgi:hypothetical protein